jgi:hypothetical protein
MPDNQPQFTTASYAPTDSVERCAACKSPLGTKYFRVNNALACESCATKVADAAPKDSHAAFVRSLIFGFGGALAGLAIYSFVGIVTGLVLGIVSIAVGYIVAKAMKAGSGGVGGQRYQIAAVLFTYFAVSMSAIPIGISYYIKNRDDARAKAAAVQQKQLNDIQHDTSAPIRPSTEPDAGAGSADAADSQDSAPAAVQSQQPRAEKSRASAIGRLLMMGIASPFLELNNNPGGIIGLLILFFGMRIAWQMMGKSDHSTTVLGPFTRSTTNFGPVAAPSTPPPPLG